MAGLLISASIVLVLESRGVGGSAQGPTLFISLSVLGLGYALLVGARSTADSISREKRDGTLGLLFLTNLRGIDVVLGKLAATSLNSIYGLIALIPILAIPLQMGGVAGGTFFQVVLCLLNALFLSLATGILVSALSYHDRKAMTTAILTVFTIAAAPFALLVYVETLDNSPPLVVRTIVWWLLIISPVSPFLIANSFSFMGLSMNQIISPGALSQSMVFAVALLISHAIAWGMLVVASQSLVTFVRQQNRRSLWERLGAWTHRFVYGNEEVRKAHRQKYLELNAFSWLTSREQLKSKYVWIFVIAIVTIYLWNLRTQGDVMFDDRTLLPLGFLIHAFVKVWIASEACYRIAEDRRMGALELLLSTPLGPWEIVKGQFLALWRQFGGALSCLFVLELILIFGFATESREGLGFQTRAIYLGGAIMLLFDAILIGWVAMWNGVMYGSANRAIVRTIIWFLMVPWVLYAVALSGWTSLRALLTNNGMFTLDLRWSGFDWMYFQHYWDRIDTAGKVLIWVVVGLAYGLKTSLFGARFKLLREFRERVAGVEVGQAQGGEN